MTTTFLKSAGALALMTAFGLAAPAQAQQAQAQLGATRQIVVDAQLPTEEPSAALQAAPAPVAEAPAPAPAPAPVVEAAPPAFTPAEPKVTGAALLPAPIAPKARIVKIVKVAPPAPPPVRHTPARASYRQPSCH